MNSENTPPPEPTTLRVLRNGTWIDMSTGFAMGGIIHGGPRDEPYDSRYARIQHEPITNNEPVTEERVLAGMLGAARRHGRAQTSAPTRQASDREYVLDRLAAARDQRARLSRLEEAAHALRSEFEGREQLLKDAAYAVRDVVVATAGTFAEAAAAIRAMVDVITAQTSKPALPGHTGPAPRNAGRPSSYLR